MQHSSIANPLEFFVCSWITDEKIRSDLINRISHKKSVKTYEQSKVVNDETLRNEYFQIWMQQPSNQPLLKLAMHPLLTREDQRLIDEYSVEERNHQIKTSAGLTAGTVAFYWLFLSRMARFQRFFNNRNKSRVFNGLKKVGAIYAVLIAWQASLSSHYEKKVPKGLHEKGLFKKYHIEFQEKNV